MHLKVFLKLKKSTSGQIYKIKKIQKIPLGFFQPCLFCLCLVHVAQVTVQAVATLEGPRAHVTHVTWRVRICGSLFSRHSRFLHPLTRMSSIVLSQIIERAKGFAAFDAEGRTHLVHLEMILESSRSVGLFVAMRAAVGKRSS